jgi:hypothetical protein
MTAGCQGFWPSLFFGRFGLPPALLPRDFARIDQAPARPVSFGRACSPGRFIHLSRQLVERYRLIACDVKVGQRPFALPAPPRVLGSIGCLSPFPHVIGAFVSRKILP